MATFEPAAKPDLAAVLDHAGIQYRDKQGSQKILCPSHGDRKPSCSLDLGKGLWNCQSCDAQGDAWTLLMITEGCDFKRAIELADKLGLPRVDGTAGTPGNAKRRGASGRAIRSALVRDSTEVGDGGGSGAPYVPSWKR